MAIIRSSWSRRWYVGHTHNERMPEALRHLEQQNFIAWSPQVVEFNKERKPVLNWLFPNYVFILFKLQDPSWRKISNTLGMRKLMSVNPETPSPVPMGVVEKLQEVYGDTGEGINDMLRPPKVNEKGKVVQGTFRDWEGLCTLREKERIVLMLDILGGLRPVAFDEKDVMVVE
jgi:transcription antitermination factor NusG